MFKQFFKVGILAMVVTCLAGCASVNVSLSLGKDKTLPLGSVVLLEEGNKRIMIYGKKQSFSDGEDNQIYDYGACYYPEGRINAESTFLFNEEQIDKVEFEGLKKLKDGKVSSDIGEGWLPMGSVVDVAGSKDPLLIIGRYQVSTETEELFEYAACSYKTGNTGPNDTWLFNHDMIEGIHFRGYEDQEELQYQEKLKNFESSQKSQEGVF